MALALGGGTHLTVLGAGPAGLAVGYYARKAGIPVAIYEASDRVGGNCATVRRGDFRFDLGAHRFHDKDEETTAEVRQLLGEDLKRIDAPSAIYHKGQMIAFPPSLPGLARGLGWSRVLRAGLEVLAARISPKGNPATFESFAARAYGKTIADLFLLNYSAKLWGLSCNQLAPEVTGTRLKGLGFNTLLSAALPGADGTAGHHEGSFYYPAWGFGQITDRLAKACGHDSIELNAPVTRIFHDGARIQELEVRGTRRVKISQVVSTLPVTTLLRILDPPPPPEITEAAGGMRYRDLILVALMLDRESVTRAATVYFPSGDFPFTRVYEPKNRSPLMAPPGKTSLVAEIPCQEGDEWWQMSDGILSETARSHLTQISWIREEEVLDSWVSRLRYAYPVLDTAHRERMPAINSYLSGLGNLKISGRNGTFAYSWMHDMIRSGREVGRAYLAPPEPRGARWRAGSDLEPAVGDARRPLAGTPGSALARPSRRTSVKM